MIEVEIRMPSRATGEYFAAAILHLRDDGGFEAVGVWRGIISLRVLIENGDEVLESVSLWDNPEAWLMNLGNTMDTDSHVPVITKLDLPGKPPQVAEPNWAAIDAVVEIIFEQFIRRDLEPSRRDVVDLLKLAGYEHPPTVAVNVVLSQTIGWPVRYSVSEAADTLAIWTEQKEILDDER